MIMMKVDIFVNLPLRPFPSGDLATNSKQNLMHIKFFRDVTGGSGSQTFGYDQSVISLY